MLTPQEEDFIKDWEVRRLQKKKLFSFSMGIPLSVFIVLAIFIMMISGWHKKATMVLRSNGSLILVIIIAAVGIVAFMTIFTARYQREQNEQRYQELLAKKNFSDKQP